MTFLFSIGERFSFNFVGTLMGSEILAIISIPFINIVKIWKEFRLLAFVLTCLAALLFAQILSDLVNQTITADALRGSAVIVFSAISSIFLTVLFARKTGTIFVYLVGTAIFAFLIGENDVNLAIQETNTNYFKQRLMLSANAALLLAVYILAKQGSRKAVVLLVFSYSIFCLFFDARANAGVHFIAAVLLAAKYRSYQFSLAKIARILFFLIVTAYLAYAAYVSQVVSGKIGGSNANVQLSMTENPYNPFELLYYGRPEFTVLLQAALDRPIVGYGSWGKDPSGKYDRMLKEKVGQYAGESRDYIRAHSILLGYWVYAGIAGVFVISVMFARLGSESASIYSSGSFTEVWAILIVLSVGIFWDLFFSPTGHLRTTFPVFIAVLMAQKYSTEKLH